MSSKQQAMRMQIQCVDKKKRNLKFPNIKTQKQLDVMKARLKGYVFEKRSTGTLSVTSQTWIEKQNKQTKSQLMRLGVIDNPDGEKFPTIEDFVDQMIKHKVGETSRRKLENTKQKLISFFGKNKRINRVTKGDADDFYAYMTKAKPEGLGLAPMSSARRVIGYCRQIWTKAQDHEISISNPWKKDSLKSTVKTNPKRHFYITPAIANKLYDVIPDGDSKLRFVLMRYAGFRAPSELNALKWKDVDLINKKMTVVAPKTAHTDDHGVRHLPIFPEVLAELNKAWDRKDSFDGDDNVLPKLSHKNLTKHVKRWIGSIGHDVWPQLLVNFRRSAVTDKHNKGFPPHILNAWFGHSDAVSSACYRMETGEASEKATEATSALHKQNTVINKTSLNPRERKAN